MTDTPEARVPRFAIAADSDGNELTVSAQGETILVEVNSQSGIGSATVELVSGEPPKNIVLRLNLKSLDEFRLSFNDGDTVVVASVSGSDASSIEEIASLPDGEVQTIAPDSPLWLDIRIVFGQAMPTIPLDQGYFEITLPRDFLHDKHRSFWIRWIDFYR